MLWWPPCRHAAGRRLVCEHYRTGRVLPVWYQQFTLGRTCRSHIADDGGRVGQVIAEWARRICSRGADIGVSFRDVLADYGHRATRSHGKLSIPSGNLGVYHGILSGHCSESIAVSAGRFRQRGAACLRWCFPFTLLWEIPTSSHLVLVLGSLYFWSGAGPAWKNYYSRLA